MDWIGGKSLTDDKITGRIYNQVIALSLLVHLSYVAIFGFLSYTILSLYNIGSSLFYLAMFYAIYKRRLRLTALLVHMEVCLFVSVCTVIGGWEIGIYLYLIAITALVYICPFQNQKIPYLFSMLELLLFFILRLYTLRHSPFYAPLGTAAETVLYLYNAGACFAIILFGAIISNLIAAVNQRQLKVENKSLQRLADYDQLTGLLCRRAFLEKLDALTASGWDASSFVLAMGDLDDFKKINDTYGHPCGDYFLCTVSELITVQCGPEALVCRWGGEEFIILFPHASLKEAKAQINSLCQAISHYPFVYENRALHITMTFGLCQGTAGMELGAMVKKADDCLYRGKSLGKNQVVCDD